MPFATDKMYQLKPQVAKTSRSIYSSVERVKSGRGAVYLLAAGGLIPCKDASLFEAFSCLWTPSSTFYKLREIERRVYSHPGESQERGRAGPQASAESPASAG